MVVIQSFTAPTEGIKLQQSATKAVVNKRDVGQGTLYITESLVSWVDTNSGQGFSLQYPHIALHAISRDISAYPHECLYLMIDADIEEGQHDDSDSSGPYEGGMTEIRFVPDDKEALDAMFQAMNACQALHPDPDDSSSEEEGEEPDAFEDADEEEDEGPFVPPVPLIRLLQRGHQLLPEDGANGFVDEDDEPMETEEGQFDDADHEPKNED